MNFRDMICCSFVKYSLGNQSTTIYMYIYIYISTISRYHHIDPSARSHFAAIPTLLSTVQELNLSNTQIMRSVQRALLSEVCSHHIEETFRSMSSHGISTKKSISHVRFNKNNLNNVTANS